MTDLGSIGRGIGLIHALKIRRGVCAQLLQEVHDLPVQAFGLLLDLICHDGRFLVRGH